MAGPLPEQHAQILAQKLADGQLALFVGAGLSRQAPAKDGSGRRMPLWKELAEQVAASCHEDLATYGGNILDLFDAIVFGQSRFDLEEAVRQALNDRDFEPSEAHRALARLPWAGVYTTNYDGLLGHVLNETPVIEEEHYDRLQRSDGQRPRLFHVHGTLEKPHTLTRDDYRLWPEKHPRAYRDLETMVLNKTVLFVGYSLSDPHFADGLLPMVRKITAGREKRLYAWMWQVPPSQVELLDRRDKIEAIPIAHEEDWAEAFRQLGDYLAAVDNKGTAVAAADRGDPFAYDRQQYFAAMQARYGFANLQGLYATGVGYARGDILLGGVFVEPALEVKVVVFAATAGEAMGPALDVRPVVFAATAGEAMGPAPVDLSLRAAVRERAKDEDDQRQRPKEETVRRERSSLVLVREAKLLIVGAPGEGKSTLLRHALLEAAARWRGQPAAHPFPVFVRLSEWEAEAGPCEGRLVRYVESRLPKLGEIGSRATAEWLKGPVLWLLDGIDEIRDPGERIRLADEVEATSALRPKHRWVVTTRPAGEPRGGLGSGWTRAVLPSLSDYQVEQVLAGWGRVLEQKEGLKLDARQVARDMKRDPGLRQVRTNALLLTLAILFFKNRKRLPHDRWEFYDAADKALRDSWLSHRIREAERYLPGDYLPELLDRLALAGMKEGQVLFDSQTLAAATRKVLTERGYTGGEQGAEVKRFLSAAQDLIGVLAEQAPDRFGFLHLTFQEFYAARAILHQSEAERTRLIAHYWDHPDWREVWPLYALAVQNEPEKYTHLFATILRAKHDLDEHLFRPQLACLRLAGLGSAPLPPAAEPVLDWTCDVLKGTTYPLSQTMAVLAGWERRLMDDLRATLLARLGDVRWHVRRAAAQALVAAVAEAEVSAALLARLGDAEGGVRGAAAQAIWAVVGEAEVRVALLAALRDAAGSVREAAARALAAAVGEAEVRAALLERLGDVDRDVRRTAAQVLAAAVGESEVKTALLAALRDAAGSVREAATKALGATVGEPLVRWALLAQLCDADESVREAAVRALAGEVAEAEVRAALLVRLGHEWLVREAAARALAEAVGEGEVRAALLAGLGDHDRDLRRAAARALAGAVGEAEVRVALLARLGDADEYVRGAAARALAGATGEAEVRAALLERLGDTDWFVRASAARALAGATGEAEVWASLLERLGDTDWFVRRAAAWALAGATGEAEVRAALLARLGDSEGFVRWAATEALAGAVGEAEVRAALLARLEDKWWEVRQAAAQALAVAAGEPVVQRALLAGLQSYYWDVRRTAARALAVHGVAEKFEVPAAEVVPVYP